MLVYCDGESHCWDVIAVNQSSIHQLYSYNLRERRWMTSRPKADVKVRRFLESAAVCGAAMLRLTPSEMMPSSVHTPEFRRSRRSSRVRLDVLLEVQDEKFAFAGQTLVVNLHGALIRTSAALKVGNAVTIHVHQTGKVAAGRIVFASYEDSPHYGVELQQPGDIWGLTDPSADWGNVVSDDSHTTT